MKKSILFLSILLFPVLISGQETEKIRQEIRKYYPLPKVDKRVELLSIVFRLAGNNEYNDESFKSYVSDIHRHFDRYRDHPLIAYAKELSNKNGVCFDAVQAMAIHLEQPPSLNPVIPFSENVPERRWGKDHALKFVTLLKQFYTDANCEEFFTEHEEMYEVAVEKLMPVYKALDVDWYRQYYGIQPEVTLNVMVGLSLGAGNYGPKVKYPDGREDNFAILGASSIDTAGNPEFPVENYLPTLIHEFNHSYVNPLLKNSEKELAGPGASLFDLVKGSMGHYASWQTMMNEALVRASVIRYLLKHHPDGNAARNQLISDFNRGFFWMKDLVDTLGSYEKNRNTYPTLESYMPVLIDFYTKEAAASKSMFEIKE